MVEYEFLMFTATALTYEFIFAMLNYHEVKMPWGYGSDTPDDKKWSTNRWLNVIVKLTLFGFSLAVWISASVWLASASAFSLNPDKYYGLQRARVMWCYVWLTAYTVLWWVERGVLARDSYPSFFSQKTKKGAIKITLDHLKVQDKLGLCNILKGTENHVVVPDYLESIQNITHDLAFESVNKYQLQDLGRVKVLGDDGKETNGMTKAWTSFVCLIFIVIGYGMFMQWAQLPIMFQMYYSYPEQPPYQYWAWINMTSLILLVVQWFLWFAFVNGPVFLRKYGPLYGPGSVVGDQFLVTLPVGMCLTMTALNLAADLEFYSHYGPIVASIALKVLFPMMCVAWQRTYMVWYSATVLGNMIFYQIMFFFPAMCGFGRDTAGQLLVSADPYKHVNMLLANNMTTTGVVTADDKAPFSQFVAFFGLVSAVMAVVNLAMGVSWPKNLLTASARREQSMKKKMEEDSVESM